MRDFRLVNQLFRLLSILKYAVGVKRTGAIVLIYAFLGALDLVGVLAFGLIATEIISGISPTFNAQTTNRIFEFLALENATLQMRVGLLTAGAVLLMVIKTISLFLVQKRIYHFLAYKSASLSAFILREILDRSKNNANSISTDLYTATTGVQNIYSHIVSNILTVVADLIVTSFLIIALIVIDPIIALFTIVSFALLALTLSALSGKRVRENGRQIGILLRQSNQEVMEAISAYREIKLRNAGMSFVSRIARTRTLIGRYMVQQQIYPNVSKYVFESFLLVLLALVSALSLTRFDTKVTFENLAMFLVASSRIGPAIMRIQLSWVQAKNGVAQSEETIFELNKYDKSEGDILQNKGSNPVFDHDGFEPRITIEGLSFTFLNAMNDSSDWKLELPKLEIDSGSKLYVLGESGSGKSTFADLLLGFRFPDTGSVSISDVPVFEVRERWPGAIAYVPQDIPIMHTSLVENILLGVDPMSLPLGWLEDLLEITQLKDWVADLPSGLNTNLGEEGIIPSGGQRQRIGLARALVTKPKLILLDESTSGLDNETEFQIFKRLDSLPWECTEVVITHRENLISRADIVLRVSINGEITLVKALD